MIQEIIVPILSTIILLITILTVFFKINKNLISKAACDKRYKKLNNTDKHLFNKTVLNQFILMEMASQAQVSSAKIKFKTFDFEKEVNGNNNT